MKLHHDGEESESCLPEEQAPQMIDHRGYQIQQYQL